MLGCPIGGGGNNGGGNNPPTPNPIEPVTVTQGSQEVVKTQSIAQTGGVIEIATTGTPIDGIKVEFPAGALPASTNVSIGYNTATVTPNSGTYAGTALVIDTGTVTEFDQPVSITVPFTDISKVPVPYYVDSAGELHPVQLIAIDEIAKTFTFQTFHASIFTWFLEIKTVGRVQMMQRILALGLNQMDSKLSTMVRNIIEMGNALA